MRILIVEDDKRLTRLMQKVLEEEKFQVDVSNRGDLGLEIGLRGVHDVIILDWMLPGQDAPSICRALRAARISASILMLTARTQVEDRVAGLYSGADERARACSVASIRPRRVGEADQRRATAPATCGAAREVPDAAP